jgi:hypothetical protein
MKYYVAMRFEIDEENGYAGFVTDLDDIETEKGIIDFIKWQKKECAYDHVIIINVIKLKESK